MPGASTNSDRWIFAAAALTVWAAMGWPFIRELATGEMRGSFPVPVAWLVPYAIFGLGVLVTNTIKLRPGTNLALLGGQFAAVAAMTFLHTKDLMAIFLVIISWQVALAIRPGRALAWIVVQTAAVALVILSAAQSGLSYIMVLAVILQLCCVLTAEALKREVETAGALVRANQRLEAAEANIADRVRDSERLRISNGLHHAWRHELKALSLQLNAACSAGSTHGATDHIRHAREISRELLRKVRDVVGDLRDGDGAREALSAPTSQSGDLAPDECDRRDYRKEKWVFSGAALAVALTLSFPVVQVFLSGKVAVSVSWIIALAVFAAGVLGTTVLNLRPGVRWAVLGLEVAAVAAMAFISSWAMMTAFLVIVAWQVATTTGSARTLGWVAIQTLVVIAAIALSAKADLCWVIGKACALQLLFVFAAQALRREERTACTLARANRELLSAHATLAVNARNTERLRVSRELHDAWGHELTAIGLQLEIASHLADAGRAQTHIAQATNLATQLLGKAGNVVATLDQDLRLDLRDALEALAGSVPRPCVHVAFDPEIEVDESQAHALMRCAQEAVTNAARHSYGANLWLRVTSDSEGVRLVARDDGMTRPSPASSGSGLTGMRERLEGLGGKLAVKAGGEFGFTLDAWVPAMIKQPA